MTTPIRADATASVLLIVDVQERLAAAMAATDRERVCTTAALLARSAGELDIPVIVTRQYPRGLGDTDAGLAEALPDWSTVLDKTSFAAPDDPAIDEALRMTARQQVVVCGMEAHVCVLQSALALLDRGYSVLVVDDGVCSRRPEHAASAHARLHAAGATVMCGESVVFEWLRDAAHPAFRTLSGLIR